MMTQNLIQNIVEQADYYLKQAGEFYPFASIMTKEGEIRPMGILLNQERPQPSEVLLELEKIANNGLSSGEYMAVAIGVHVSVKKAQNDHFLHELFQHDVSAGIEIRIKDSASKPFKIMALPYTIDALSGEVIFEEFLRVRQV